MKLYHCPYCETKNVPEPLDGAAYQKCNNCGKHPCVKRVVSDKGKKMLIQYVKTSYARLEAQDVKRQRSCKLSDRVMANIRARGYTSAQAYLYAKLSADGLT